MRGSLNCCGVEIFVSLSFNTTHKIRNYRTVYQPNGDELRVHTNSVEGMWRRLKRPLAVGSGTSADLLHSYVDEFVVRENEGEKFGLTFFSFIIKHTEQL